MLVETQELLIHWFMKAQSRDLTKWLCAKRVLRDDNQGSYTKSTSMSRRACDAAQKSKGLGLQIFSSVFEASGALAWLY